MSARRLVIADGPFGHAVAERLARDHGAALVDLAALEAFGSFQKDDVVVVAAWREEAALFDRLDNLAFERYVRWLPIVLEHPFVRVGPFVDPAEGPCYRCFRRRLLQHDEDPQLAAAMRETLEADRAQGVSGFLGAHAGLAACLAVRELQPGSYVRFHVGTGALDRASTTRLGTCKRCGPPATAIRGDALVAAVRGATR
jgi:bacteriocin biosynthesis cyclodehydratase domain-containing protein